MSNSLCWVIYNYCWTVELFFPSMGGFSKIHMVLWHPFLSLSLFCGVIILKVRIIDTRLYYRKFSGSNFIIIIISGKRFPKEEDIEWIFRIVFHFFMVTFTHSLDLYTLSYLFCKCVILKITLGKPVPVIIGKFSNFILLKIKFCCPFSTLFLQFCFLYGKSIMFVSDKYISFRT